MIVRAEGSVRTAVVGLPLTDGDGEMPCQGYRLPGVYLSWKLSPMTSCVKHVKDTLEPLPHTREGGRGLWGWVTLHWVTLHWLTAARTIVTLRTRGCQRHLMSSQ